MRIDVKKFLFLGLEEEREAFFKEAQEFGFIHFIEESRKEKDLPEPLYAVVQAIKILHKFPPRDQEESEAYELTDKIAGEIIRLKDRLDSLQEEERTLKLESARVAPFGAFALSDLAYIQEKGRRVVQFYFTKHIYAHNFLADPELLYVGSEHNLSYFVGIHQAERHIEHMGEMKIEHPINELKARLKEVHQAIHAVEKELKELVKYLDFLYRALTVKLNDYQLVSAKEAAKGILGERLFSIEGFVPTTKLPKVKELLRSFHVVAEETALESKDRVPTCLENNSFGRIGEDVISIYDTPSIHDKDPSIFVLSAFALFFAFIINDAGYGLIFVLLLGFLFLKMKKITSFGRRFFYLSFFLSGACIFFGILTNSYFSIPLKADSPLRRASLLHLLVNKKVEYHWERHDAVYQEWIKRVPELAKVQSSKEVLSKGKTEHTSIEDKFSDVILMELALLIGGIHIILGMLRYVRYNLAFIGWILAIIGGFLYFPIYLDSVSLLHYVLNIPRSTGGTEGLYLIYGGVGLATLCALFQHKWKGIFEPLTAIQIFADTLSYLRLYALGVAGALVASVINDFTASIPLILAVPILIFGHFLNISLSIMSGVIHGLRLNFLEWYHYSFEGGGKKFQPLEKKKIE